MLKKTLDITMKRSLYITTAFLLTAEFFSLKVERQQHILTIIIVSTELHITS